MFVPGAEYAAAPECAAAADVSAAIASVVVAVDELVAAQVSQRRTHHHRG
jgi:hypothetical protein